MKGEAKQFLKFIDGSDKRFIIPVYQRNYSWQNKHCAQLLNDLKGLIKSLMPLISSVVLFQAICKVAKRRLLNY
ncbi:DUF262 domain-containing protein [Acinetobacter ursingii]|uniref:DUF262 domain-containing protein n=1 Tax=Acinetobacter ursingii TaxID=108980 RepID=A0AA46NPM1_9GAMM|nr:DUF262 domain-containing protein [Acinetobacter ursingii]UYF76022.1 DUF262 domain-containing protein [Acinetobacter ursingii]